MKHDAVIVTDEVYEHLTFGPRHIPVATLPGADNRHVPGTAHVHMAFRHEVYDEVRRCLKEAD